MNTFITSRPIPRWIRFYPIRFVFLRSCSFLTDKLRKSPIHFSEPIHSLSERYPAQKSAAPLACFEFFPCTTDSGSLSFQWDVDRKFDGGSLSDSPETGKDSSTCSWWIRLLIGRNTVEAALTRSEAAGKERKYSERRSATMATAKLLGWDCCCLLLLLWRRKRSPHKRIYVVKWQRDYSIGTGRKYLQLCVVWRRMYTELHVAFSLLKLKAQGVGVKGVRTFRSFSAQSDSTMEISSCTPWQQYCRTYRLDFPTSSTIKGVRGAVGGRQSATANPPCIYCNSFENSGWSGDKAYLEIQSNPTQLDPLWSNSTESNRINSNVTQPNSTQSDPNTTESNPVQSNQKQSSTGTIGFNPNQSNPTKSNRLKSYPPVLVLTIWCWPQRCINI